MSCHFSCSTCVASLFTNCLTCSSLSTLSNAACFCNVPWDSSCTTISTLRNIFQIIDSFFLPIIALVMICYCLKAKLMISYRILVGFQSLSMLLFTTQSYLNYESIFGLTTLYKANGYYGYTYRNETLSYIYILPPAYLFFSFLVLYLILFKPRHLFVRAEDDYENYLKVNAYDFFSYFYTFGARGMLYFMGLWLTKMQVNVTNLIIFIICGVFVLIVIVKSIRDFHNNSLDQQIYEPQLQLYNSLSSLSMIGLPLATSTIPIIVVYLSPVALLIFIIMFNKNYIIFTKPKIIFYIVQALIASFAVAFVMVDYTIKGVVVLIAILLGILTIVVQVSLAYYGGFNLRSSKIHPETSNAFIQGKKEGKLSDEGDKNVLKSSYKKQRTYF